MAASLPPSSTQTGVRAWAAEVQTACATGRLPMKVRWLRPGWEVRVWAAEGQQVMDWTRDGERLQAFRAPCTSAVKYLLDQAVASEPLITIALPVKRAEMMGPRRLWNWRPRQ